MVFLTGLAGPFKNAWGDELSKNKALYLAKCSKCHRLYDPKEYDDEAWASWMAKMKKKAHLNEEQYGRISKYLKLLRKG